MARRVRRGVTWTACYCLVSCTGHSRVQYLDNDKNPESKQKRRAAPRTPSDPAPLQDGCESLVLAGVPGSSYAGERAKGPLLLRLVRARGWDPVRPVARRGLTLYSVLRPFVPRARGVCTRLGPRAARWLARALPSVYVKFNCCAIASIAG